MKPYCLHSSPMLEGKLRHQDHIYNPLIPLEHHATSSKANVHFFWSWYYRLKDGCYPGCSSNYWSRLGVWSLSKAGHQMIFHFYRLAVKHEYQVSKNQETLPLKQVKCHLSVMLSISRKQRFLLHAELTPVKLQSSNIPSVHQPCCVQFGAWHPAVPAHGGDNLHTWQMCTFTVQTLKGGCAGRGSFPEQMECESRWPSTLPHKRCVFPQRAALQDCRTHKVTSSVGMHYVQSVHLLFCQVGNLLRAGL